MPANIKISGLPAAGPVAGPELIEVVQNTPPQQNKQTTAGNVIGLVSTQYSIGGNPTAPALNASLANQFTFMTFNPAVTANTIWITYNTGNSPPGWNQTSNAQTVQDINSLGATLGSSVRLNILTCAAAANSAAEWFSAATALNGNFSLYRVPVNGFLTGGFTMTVYLCFPVTTAGMQVFFGFAGVANTNLGGSQVPSALPNMVGLGKDASDTNLQFMINNASGSATKALASPLSMTAIQGHFLRFVMTCDGAGNVNFTLTDLETGGATVSVSYPTSTAKLPAAFSGTTGQLTTHFHINNGAAGGVPALGINYAAITGGFGSV